MPNQRIDTYKMGRADASHFEGEGSRWKQNKIMTTASGSAIV